MTEVEVTAKYEILPYLESSLEEQKRKVFLWWGVIVFLIQANLSFLTYLGPKFFITCALPDSSKGRNQTTHSLTSDNERFLEEGLCVFF